MRQQKEILDIIQNSIRNNDEICFYGMGKIGANVGRDILSLIDIYPDFYCDRDEKKWGKRLKDELVCMSPEQLSQKEKVICYVLLGQYYERKAITFLEKLGIKKIVSLDEICSLDMVIDRILDRKVEFDNRYMLSQYMKYEQVPKYKIQNKNKKRMAVYTCITGNYDKVVEPEVVSDDCDYYIISDEEPQNLEIYQWIDAKKIIPKFINDNYRRNRYCKIFGYKIFEDYEYSIYLDGNVRILGDITNYPKCVRSSGFASHNHAYYHCLYAEGVKVIAAKIEKEEVVISQLQRYRGEGMPRNFGQFQNAILVRENRNPVLDRLMSDWWKEVFTKSYRDQLSLSYCIWKNGIDIKDIGVIGPDMRENKDFEWVSRHH